MHAVQPEAGGPAARVEAANRDREGDEEEEEKAEEEEVAIASGVPLGTTGNLWLF